MSAADDRLLFRRLGRASRLREVALRLGDVDKAVVWADWEQVYHHDDQAALARLERHAEPLEAAVYSVRWKYRVTAPVALTAAAAGLVAATAPRAWFDDPHLDGPTPLTITDEGRVFGHVALWDSCHTAFQGRCVTPPRSRSNYSSFHLGEVKTAEGGRVAVGTISFGTGHAGLGLPGALTVRHYSPRASVGSRHWPRW